MATRNFEEFDDEMENDFDGNDLLGNPFFEGSESDYFLARRGQRGAALARQIVDVMEADPSEFDADQLQEVVKKRHSGHPVLYMPTATRPRRGPGRCRTVYCVDLGESGDRWCGLPLEDQFRKLSIFLNGHLMKRAMNGGKDWIDILPMELIVITDRWDQSIAEWVPMLQSWAKVMKSFELYLVAPGMVHRIEFEL